MKVYFFILLAIFLVGCNTFEGLGKDLRKGGEIIENAAK